MYNAGTQQQGASFRIPFNTVTADDPPIPVSPSASWVDADFFFRKGGTVTAIDAAATTPSTDLNTTVGAHELLIDLSGDADFTGGSEWQVWLAPSTTTVDGADVAVCIGTFRIESDAERAFREIGLVLERTVIGATGNSTSALNVAAGSYADDELENELGIVQDVSTGRLYPVRCTGPTSNILGVTAVDGTVLPFTPQASVDIFYRTGSQAPALPADVTAHMDASSTQLALILSNMGTPVGADLSTDIANALSSILTRLGSPAGASVSADIAAVQSLLTSVAGYVDTEVATIVSGVASIITILGTPVGADMSADIAAVAALIGTPVGADLSADIAATAALVAAAAIGDATWDEVLEGSYTARQLMRLMASALFGKVSGLDTTAPAFRDLADTKDRIAATVDASGNRSALTLDGA